jgi:hypothetical protein
MSVPSLHQPGTDMQAVAAILEAAAMAMRAKVPVPAPAPTSDEPSLMFIGGMRNRPATAYRPRELPRDVKFNLFGAAPFLTGRRPTLPQNPIRDLRNHLEMSRRQFAILVGRTVDAVRDLEKGCPTKLSELWVSSLDGAGHDGQALAFSYQRWRQEQARRLANHPIA